MADRMSSENMNIDTVVISKIDLENSEIYIKGEVPGPRGAFVYIEAEGVMPEVKTEKIKETSEQVEVVEEVKDNEDVVEETKVVEESNESVVTEADSQVNESNEK